MVSSPNIDLFVSAYTAAQHSSNAFLSGKKDLFTSIVNYHPPSWIYLSVAWIYQPLIKFLNTGHNTATQPCSNKLISFIVVLSTLCISFSIPTIILQPSSTLMLSLYSSLIYHPLHSSQYRQLPQLSMSLMLSPAAELWIYHPLHSSQYRALPQLSMTLMLSLISLWIYHPLHSSQYRPLPQLSMTLMLSLAAELWIYRATPQVRVRWGLKSNHCVYCRYESNGSYFELLLIVG